ncbi:MAG: MmcQ/YjbR family DNA-binding protein [Desertimonas sp.]
MSDLTGDLAELERFALSLPEAWPDTPWDGDPVAKVGKKIFVFLGSVASPSMAVKLPDSADHALSVAGAAPTGYGLGRHGWCTVPLDGGDVPLDLLIDWIEESYRTVAPKKLVRRLDESG